MTEHDDDRAGAHPVEDENTTSASRIIWLVVVIAVIALIAVFVIN